MIRAPLRSCPACGSKAVSAFERDVTEAGDVRVELCCGECRTWRGGAVGRRAAARLERRIRRDRRQIELSLGQEDRWREYELAELTRCPPQGARRRTLR